MGFTLAYKAKGNMNLFQGKLPALDHVLREIQLCL